MANEDYKSSPLAQDIIVVDDNYSDGYARAYTVAGNEIERIMTEYCTILTKLVQNKGLEGDTANKILEFANLANGLLKGIPSTLGKQKQEYMNAFQQEIDVQDKEIY